MDELVSPARWADGVLALVGIEAFVLAILHARTGRGVAPREFLPTLASGAALLLALRSALSGHGPLAIGAWLAAAGASHLVDLLRRWKTPR